MLRLHHSDPLRTGEQVILSKDSAHHLIHVMRAKVDDTFIIFNASGEFEANILSVDKKNVSAKITQQRSCQTESPCKITLIQAITRRERMDYSIQKATELGVTCIQPVLSEHCVVKLDAKKAQQRLHHWQGIAQHASEQSGRLLIPEIKPVLRWSEAIDQEHDNKDSLKLIFALIAARPLADIQLNDTQSNDTQQKTQHISIAVGPVGGFSESEVQLAQAQGFHAIKLGPRILRAETATTAALTAVQMLWGDLNVGA